MTFPPVPKYSKNMINRAGEILVNPSSKKDKLKEARDVVNAWRACHAYPINTFQATLRKKVKGYSNPIVAQRLKRLATIEDKLTRHPHMKLSTMQDIGGVRAVVGSVTEVKRLAAQYRDAKRFTHEISREYDYISEPKDDGYRGIHLVYKYHNTQARNKIARDYDGLLLELQIRTKLQHIWATAVETMGTVLGQALKSRTGDKEWLEFFSLTSSAFADKERSPRVAAHDSLSKTELYAEVKKAATEAKVLDKISGLTTAINVINIGGYSGFFYHLIELDSLNKRVRISPYGRDQLSEASAAYSEAETRAAIEKKIEPVLVAAGDIGSLRRAYPNFFLDVKEFVEQVKQIIEPAV